MSKKTKFLPILVSVIVSFAFVAAVTFAATTISSNINTGGTLTVTGASTLTGAVWATSTLQATGVTTLYNDLVVDTSTLIVDSTNNRVGVGTTSPTVLFSVGGAAGTVTGDVYMTGGLAISTSTTNSVEGTILLASGWTTDPNGVEGLIYYNTEDGNVRLYNGSTWGVIGTSTGFDLTAGTSNIVLSGLSNFMTLGTTTAQGNSLLTLEATSTSAIPLTIVGDTSQAGNTLQIMNDAASNLLYVDSAGGLFGSSTGQFTGAVTTYGAVTLGDAALDAIVLTGNASTTNALTVGDNLFINGYATTTGSNGDIATEGDLTVNSNVVLGDAASDTVTLTGNASTTNSLTIGDLASTSRMVIGGNGSTMAGLIFGYCTIPETDITASSTADNTISVRIYNTGYVDGTGTTTSNTQPNSFNFIGIR